MPATNDLLLRIIKDINDIRSALRRTTANLPLFDIDNENSPALIGADKNDYLPGNYDVLRLTSDALRNITGISGGMKGRKLRIFNVGSYAITLVHQSGSSLAANRFSFVNASNFVIPPSGNVLLYYDWTTSRWIGGDQASMFDVVNEITALQITSNQDNYDPGVYEVLRLSTDAARTITGISGGVKGRSLQIFNVGSYAITLANQSTSSLAANRFKFAIGANVVILPGSSIKLYYDSTQGFWIEGNQLEESGIAKETTAAQITSNQNNYDPSDYNVLRLTSDADRTITGISGGVKGRFLQIFNVGSYSIILAYESGSSTAGNRFKFAVGSNVVVLSGSSIKLYYDTTQSRWVEGNQLEESGISKETTPAQITANQNNYDPSDYSVLRLSTDASRTITGISGGVKGRTLQIYNVGSNKLTLAYESGSSTAGNRFYSPSAESTVLYPKSGVRLYYDSTLARWIIPDAPTWMGTYGKTAIVSASGTQSIPNDTTTKITCLDTVVNDDWGMWSVANQRITIPETGVYLGVFGVQFPADSGGDGSVRAIQWQKSGITLGIIQVPPCLYPVATDLTVQLFYKFAAGDTVEIYALQDCGASLNMTVWQFAFTRIT